MRDIPVGNGNLLVNFDDKYQIRDIYFPHVGQENHTEGFPFRFGVWADGEFSWVFSDDWERSLKYLHETLVTDVVLTNKKLGVKITCNDTVASHDNIFLRRIRVTNLIDAERDVRVFLHHDFRLYENNVGDTAFYDPENLALVHYKKHRYFLINTEPHFDTFATGRKAFRDQEGTWRDAEDGELHGGVITEGSVDSTIGLHFSLTSGETSEFYYWISAGTTHSEVAKLNRLVLARKPFEFLAYTENYWRAWVNKNDVDFGDLPQSVIDLYKHSLLIISTQIDDGGAILAANDWDVTERATDHYSYLWTRDGAFVANALDAAGYPEITRTFFDFCNKIPHPKGYFMQKYNPDGTVASGWHASWDIHNKRQLVPIQEDETALVIWSLWQHYEWYRDIDFAHRLYVELVVDCARFMVEYRDPETKLPQPSWNLWEDRRGIHTFTCSTVVAGLRAAANFAELFGENDNAITYKTAANEIVEAMREHLYSPQLGRFLRSLQVNGDHSLTADTTIDASLFGVFYFDCFDIDDEMVVGTMKAVEEKLSNNTEFGGLARFENDSYMKVSEQITGNSWFICTLWLAEYYIAKAKTAGDLLPALEILQWTVDRALPSGVLAEQVDPLTGEEISVSPLTWSHSTFVATVHSYLDKRKTLAS
ncbi:MAG: glycoside hydrolase family 15 protein [Chloracidobacterium sp.]|nr:glycoside hydrolase family 15 protein [Chloracidobacterium sp.]